VKKALTIGVAVAVLAATLSLVGAGSVKQGEADEARALPAEDILASVRAMGLNPTGDTIRRGPYYILHAYDPRGSELRIVADAHFGDILSVTPIGAQVIAYAPSYQRGPRIIHVPQPGDYAAPEPAKPAKLTKPRASVRDDYDDAVDLKDDTDVEDIAPPPPRKRVTRRTPAYEKPAPRTRPAPRWQPHAKRQIEAAPTPPALPPGPPRAVLSAPPPTPMGGLTPIRPTPNFGAKDSTKADPADGTKIDSKDAHAENKDEASDKFALPGDESAATPRPPPGYTPPSGVPRAD
jgi:hypothetical protein